MPIDDNFLHLTSISQRVNDIMTNTQKVSKNSQKKKPILKPQRPLPKSMANKVPTNPPGMQRSIKSVKSNPSYYDCIERARVLDKKIKASMQPSYEDLKAFHDISKEMEEKL